MNESWFAEFLAIPIILDSIDVNATVYRDIEQLPPAHWLAVEDGKLALGQYDALEAPREQLRLKSNGEYEEAFRDVFQEAVTSKLRTFRQVGASLSGGLDSGAVIGFAANPLLKEGKSLHAYSYVPSPDFVDWTSRRMVADETSLHPDHDTACREYRAQQLGFSGPEFVRGNRRFDRAAGSAL